MRTPGYPPVRRPLADAFLAVARTHGERTAVVSDHDRLDYRTLAGWSGAVARRLGPVGAPGELVAVRMAASPAAVATLVGVILAGGAYLPADPAAPDDRLRALVTECGVRTLFADPSEVDRLRAVLPGVRVLSVDRPPTADGDLPEPPLGEPAPLAYVIATSGSTGRPKAVEVADGSVLALARAPEAGLGPDDVVLQLAPLHVDPSVFEIWGALLNGATLALPGRDRPSVHDIGRAVRRHRVTVLRLAAPLFRLAMEHVADDLRGLRLCISGGDRAGVAAVRTALRRLPHCTIVNGYGPTETTVYACWLVLHGERCYDESWPDVPIGRPLSGARAHVLGPDRRPVAPGEEGELCVGGGGVARGYRGQPDLTAERFVPEPGHPGRTAYLTGDRVRLLPDGNLRFLGRTDDQVKIRGYRVEPAETERTLLRHPAVREAAVVAPGPELNRRLAAFVVLREPAAVGDLIGYAAATLPPAQVPATVTVLPALPVTANGKADRRALTGQADRRPGTPAVAPDGGTATEHLVAGLVGQVLGAPVGPDTDFLAAGGDSLAAMTVAAGVERARGVAVGLGELLTAATVREIAALVDATAARARTAGPPAEPAAALPLLPGQRGVWFDQQGRPPHRYLIRRTFLVAGPVDVARLRAAFHRVAARQEALRMVVRRDGDEYRQVPAADPDEAFVHHDLRELPAGQRQARVDALLARPTTGTDGTPLARLLVARLAADRTVVHVELHHVIADDWSVDVLLADLSASYADAAAHPARLRYADHVRQTLARLPERLPAAVRWWRQAVDGGALTLDLVTDRPRPAVLSGAGDRVRLRVGEPASAHLAEAARRHGISRFMLCLAGVYTVLAAHTERDALCLGSLTNGRGPDTTDLIGYLVNVLPIRVAATGDTPVEELLGRVRDACVGAYRHQDVPAQSVCRELGLTGASRGALPFPVVVNYQQRPPRPLRLGLATVDPRPIEANHTAKFELMFSFQESPGGLDIEVEFSTDLYRRDSVERLAGQLVATLDRLANAEAGTVLRDIGPHEPDEERRWPAEQAPGDSDATLHGLFARSARTYPDRTAVVGDDTVLSYRELDQLSDTVAGRLSALGVGPGDRVALCLARTPRLVVSILGVLKTGAAYVPLDPDYPVDRLRFVLADAAPRAVISTKDIIERHFPPSARTGALPPLLDIDRLIVPADETPALRESRADAPAYLIYTSGSTGRPRGAVLTHRSVANTLHGNLARHPFASDDVWLQLTSPGFDVAAYEQFMPLVSGGTLVYCGDDVRADGAALTRHIRDNGVTVLVMVPSLLRALGRPDLGTVRILLVAGEPADPHDTRHFARDRVVINGYGPTEAAILATTHQAGADEDRARIPIGRPLPGTTAHVIDRHGRLAATGVPGELWLGGAGVGVGYWNQPERTAELFTTHPALGGQRLYRTGDRVRRLPDGTLDYLGRLDGQIKLRGFRIELGEIEMALAGHPSVSEALAVLLGAGADARLAVAYVGPAAPEDARAHLVRLLPAYMVPRTVAAVSALPVNGNGKADRRALAEQLAALRAPAPGVPVARPGGLAGQLVALWQEILGDVPVGPTDDFFAVGGDSLRVIRLLTAVERRHGTRIPVRDFLTEPTIRAMVRQLSDPAEPAAGVALVGPDDARLDPDIRFDRPTPPPGPGDPILLTGATGFVGAHVLGELLRATDGPVRCLVRASTVDAARARIAEAARRYGVPVDPADPRIEPLCGDLQLPGLGLTADALRAARAATTVLHVGATVHHLSGFHHLAAANVAGTAEVLRIAASGTPARVHHVSTLGVLREPGAGRPGRLSEASPVAGERHSRGGGYAATKWAAEQLVAQAVARGAHARIYRLGRAGPSATSGVSNADDMLTRLLATSAALGCYPDDERLHSDLLPVDVMARALVALALAEAPAGTVRHLHHPRRTSLATLLAGHDRRTGGTTRPVPLGGWLDRLGAATETGAALPALAYREHLRELRDRPGSAVAYDNQATLSALSAVGVALPDLDDALVDRWWRDLDSIGGTAR
ncbi:amino acid adenylation domain-containing protein [Micromonospora sp. PLK6-60]|uniref:non-ribosomal peptide synthetase n=1 Tax=Micromonospora sp. PLK6-60 TaxID=2873383 RepID=UPI001CA7092B|nr:non-ribosomal peptide synthetase [Micromonospora sp. PLK6-60]MBY8875063.1 amino acid adenylation domain-containing protein [Micromonospora sp. PLK6-60]